MRRVIRLQQIELINFKNVENGTVCFQSYIDLKRKIKSKKDTINNISDIIGVYGQNGSGKTALIEALELLKEIISGNPISDEVAYLISNLHNQSKIKTIFTIELNQEKFLVYYTFGLRKNKELIQINEETISYRKLNNNKRNLKRKILEYDVDNPNGFKPISKLKSLIQKNKNNLVNIGVIAAISSRDRKSFIFNVETINIIKNINNEYKSEMQIVETLMEFGKMNLFVIRNQRLGVVNLNHLLPFTFRVENKEEVISGDCITLFKPSLISEEKSKLLAIIIKQIDIVINSIIPGLSIGIANYGSELSLEGDKKIKVEIISIRNDKRIPLKYESDGIKKIVSILSAIIGMYNNESICLVVDELDAGIYEYLLGELLSILQERARGQFIFTSHNLRPLEKLNKNSIIFTTNNPNNRYIRLTNVKNNNLRDFYLRSILLGGQKEEVYDQTNTFEINYAFRRAGRVKDEN